MGFKVKDHYYNKAKKDNYVARSVYKLEEIDKKYKILRKGDNVVDFGYHPGSWIQYTSKKIGMDSVVVGLDIRPINDKITGIANIKLFEKDINDIESLEELGVDKMFDVVLSDMAPNTTGIKDVDQIRSLQLVEMVFHWMPKFLKTGGNTVIKVFDSNDAQQYLKTVRSQFKEFHHLKPKSTRSVSKEFFVIGIGYKGE
jgi:23S rRNA (uridine2552-2'-O)-methyltransferase